MSSETFMSCVYSVTIMKLAQDLVGHPSHHGVDTAPGPRLPLARANMSSCSRRRKAARKLSSGFKRIEALQLVADADDKVLDTLGHQREASASGAAFSASGAASSQEPAPAQSLPGEAVCHWWASWFQNCAECDAPLKPSVSPDRAVCIRHYARRSWRL